MYQKVVIIFSLLLFQNPSFGFNAKNADIDIESKELEVFINENKAKFTGNVVAKQNDFIVKSDELILFFHKDKMEKVIFLNNVKIHAGNQVAYGDRGEYSQNNPIFKLTGKVHLMQNHHEFRGDIFTYNVKTKEASISTIKDGKVIGKKRRVKAKFNSNLKANVSS